jgi:hypothetical protein
MFELHLAWCWLLTPRPHGRHRRASRTGAPRQELPPLPCPPRVAASGPVRVAGPAQPQGAARGCMNRGRRGAGRALGPGRLLARAGRHAEEPVPCLGTDSFFCPNTAACTARRSSGRREPLAATAAPLAAVGAVKERSAVGVAAEGSRALEPAPRPTVPCLRATESVSAEEINAQPRRLVIASIVRDPAWRPSWARTTARAAWSTCCCSPSEEKQALLAPLG